MPSIHIIAFLQCREADAVLIVRQTGVLRQYQVTSLHISELRRRRPAVMPLLALPIGRAVIVQGDEIQFVLGPDDAVT
jgi:hypothetical protein